MKRPRILLADDHPVMLEDIRAVLAPHCEIVEAVADGRALVEAALRLKPDLIVTDIAMPHLNGIHAAVQIKKNLPGIKLLFVTMHSNTAYIEAAFEAGGTGYVLKSGLYDELPDAVQSVLGGRSYVSRCLSTKHREPCQHPAAAVTCRLSKRERETLHLIAEGRAAEEIARAMNISIKTVAFYQGNIKRKLGLRTTSELTKHTSELGQIP